MKRSLLLGILFYCIFASTVFGQSIENKLWFDLDADKCASVAGYNDKSQLSESDSVVFLPTYVQYGSSIFKVKAIANAAFSGCTFIKNVESVEDTLQIYDSDIRQNNYSILFKETFASSLGKFQNVTAEGAIEWVNSYSCATATGFNNSTLTQKAGICYLVSPEVDLTEVDNAHISYEYILRYRDKDEYQKLLIIDSEKYNAIDIENCSWTTIYASHKEGMDYSTFTTADVNIPKSFYGKKVRFALRFQAGTKSATWEVKNFKVLIGVASAGDGTADNPLTVAQLQALFDANSIPSTKIYVKGIVSEVQEISTSYGFATYFISDDGTAAGQFEVYRGYALDGNKFTAEDQLQVGDEVIVYGQVVLYNKTREFTTGSQLYYSSRLGQGGGDTPTPPGPTPYPVNLDDFQNGDFETWEGGLPTHWKSTSTASSATLSQSADAHGGNYSVCVEGTTSANKRLAYEEMTLAAGTYIVKFFVKAESAAASVCPGYVPVVDGKAGSYAYGDYVNDIPSDTWTEVTHQFTLTATTTVNLVVMNSKKYGANVLIDDFTIVLANDWTYRGKASRMRNEPQKTTVPLNNVGEHAFTGCSNLKSVVLPESITNIDAYAFLGCTNLQSLYIPQNIQNVNTNAFVNCPNLVQLSVTPYQTKAEVQTSHGFVSQNKLHVICNAHEVDKNGFILLQHLAPNTYFDVNIKILLGDVLIYRTTHSEITKSLHPTIKCISGVTTLNVRGSYEEEDATVVKTAWIGPNKDIILNVDSIQFDNLSPDYGYKIVYRLYYDNDAYEDYSIYSYTNDLVFETNVPKVVDKTSAIVGAITNIPEDEIHIGFEWRKIDAPDLVPSKVGSAYIYNGVMESKIMGLSTDSYYKVRPFYESFEGNKYYGDWIGFDPSDYSYTNPTVHTYNINTPLTSNQVTVRGYVIAGTDNIEEQGFEYWPVGFPLLTCKILGTGQSMFATISGLMYNTKYAVRAYVKTGSDTKYGETVTFRTPLTDNIDYIYLDKKKDNDAVYDMQGRLIGNSERTNLKSLRKGIYIINGKKILIR